MFAPFIDNNLKFIEKYFSLLINNNNKFPQSIILYGEDIFTQYLLALNLAKILNCKQTKKFNCDCLDCNWIKNNKHPAVITVSKNDFKPENDDTRTVISVAQARNIKNTLASTSEYYRVFILCDSEIKIPTTIEQQKIQQFKDTGFHLPHEEETDDKFWIPKGLNSLNFSAEPSNALLKSIEEPSTKTAFIFLTQNKNDLLETIISRSQCFYVPTQHQTNPNIEQIANELKHYPEIDRLEINNIAQKILSIGEKENITPENTIVLIQEFIKQTILANNNNQQIINKMLIDIQLLHETQKQIKNYIKPQSALENALYLIYKNWE